MGHTRLSLKFASLAALVLLVSACASQTTETTTTTTTGTGEVVPGSNEELSQVGPSSVFFDYNKYNLRPSSLLTLERQAQWLQTYSGVKVTIEGHCDERGTREYNLALGARRANSVKDYLVSLGVAPSRITTISYGKERPAVLGSNENAWSQNRRSVTMVTDGAAP
jgi:peptidoglycan-associated lipoprotein